MGDLLCKIWRGILRIFEGVVNAVATGIKIIGTATVDVLSELAESVSDAVFGNSGSLILLGAGLFALYLFTKKEDGDERSST